MVWARSGVRMRRVRGGRLVARSAKIRALASGRLDAVRIFCRLLALQGGCTDRVRMGEYGLGVLAVVGAVGERRGMRVGLCYTGGFNGGSNARFRGSDGTVGSSFKLFVLTPPVVRTICFDVVGGDTVLVGNAAGVARCGDLAGSWDLRLPHAAFTLLREGDLVLLRDWLRVALSKKVRRCNMPDQYISLKS